MTLPTSMRVATARSQTGIVLQVFPSTQNLGRIELQNSTQATTGTTTWKSRYLDQSSGTYTVAVEAPLSTRTYYFRARHYGEGYAVSPFTPIVSAKPVKFGTGMVSIPIVRNKTGSAEIPGAIYLPSSATLYTGAPSQVTPTTYTVKTIRVPAAELVPRRSSESWEITSVYATPRTTGAGAVQLNLKGAIVVPKGVTLTEFRARMYRVSTAAAASAILQGIASDASTNIAQCNFSTGTGWRTIVATLSKLVGDESYATEISLTNPLGGVTGDARYQYAELEYRVPSVAKTY